MQTESVSLTIDGYSNFKRFNNIFCEIIPQTPYNLLSYKPDYIVHLMRNGSIYDRAHLNNVKPCLFGLIPITIVELCTGLSYVYAREYYCDLFKVSFDVLDELPVMLLVLRKLL